MTRTVPEPDEAVTLPATKSNDLTAAARLNSRVDRVQAAENARSAGL